MSKITYQLIRIRGIQWKSRRTYSTTVSSMIKYWSEKFEEHEVSEPKSSINNIMAHVFNSKEVFNLKNKNMNSEQIEKLNRLCQCRLAGMPVQYIIGEWDFRDTTLALVPPVFIPRPETEMLVDIVINNTQNVNSMLEIGCGSGAICVSLLKTLPKLKVVAVDLNEEACKLTKLNADSCSVGDRIDVLNTKLSDDGTLNGLKNNSIFDVIISNPPYLYTSEICDLQPEIKLYEDIRALDGGSDGLRLVKAVLILSSQILQPDSSCFLEVHHMHLNPVTNWLMENSELKLMLIESFKDFAGYERFIHLKKI